MASDAKDYPMQIMKAQTNAISDMIWHLAPCIKELQGVEKQSAQKLLIVLGGDPNPTLKGMIRSFKSNEKPKCSVQPLCKWDWPAHKNKMNLSS
ncbi:hypothetical protein RJ639_038721 [Escallonia herrerae]|uniref:Uncharacterized protein n=1 Tax=Escallonia herrerae TaxID=1293975 RepID=A0AA89BFK7_9ASTE|nr:hypothetical protein RJ639_038721 [Escallonia herrerae]